MVNRRLRYELGLEAENITSNYLISIGYIILYKRWKSKYGEIDIVAKSHDTILFVEVKAKKESRYEQGIVSMKQRKRNSKAALDFLGQSDINESLNIRFDCAIVTNKKIAHYIENAWYIEEQACG